MSSSKFDLHKNTVSENFSHFGLQSRTSSEDLLRQQACESALEHV
jgi:hypothetical protein